MLQNEFYHIKNHTAFDGIDVIDAQFIETSFGKHAHSEYVISLVEKGVKQFFHKGKTHTAGVGAISVISPDEIHTGNKGQWQGWRYKAIYPTEEHISNIYYEIYSRNGLPTFKDSVIIDSRFQSYMQMLFSKMNSHTEQLEIEIYLELILVKMIMRYGSVNLSPIKEADAKSNIQRVRDFLADHYTKKVSLDDLSALSGVNKYHLIHEFKRYFGSTPHQFQIQQRISNSQMMLKQGIKPIDVALCCGFHDQSHFHKAFVSAMGVTPSMYQRQFFTR
ncbi:AraC family ligand binding domain-containing protein [Vibrio sp. TRT 17S01]|uniref:AraC family ligand binding domain-containing protein n=1 Tax=Vibrio sp. TRT 17S01 TaxID=3418505 RepID=UPI003CE82972